MHTPRISRAMYISMFNLLCLVGLFYQTFILISQYYEQKIVVNIEYQDNVYHKMPAVTICYNTPLSLRKVAMMFPELAVTYRDYLNYLQSGRNVLNRTIEEVIKDINRGLNYPEIVENYYNLTIGPNDVTGGEPMITVRIDGYRTSDDMSLVKFTEYFGEINGDNVNMVKFKPLQVLLTGVDLEYTLKCFTYFHKLNQEWRKQNYLISSLIIRVNYMREWNIGLGMEQDKFFSLAIHSPDELPVVIQSCFFGHYYALKYDRWTINMNQVKHFDKINCMDYDINAEISKNKMRSNCITECVHDQIRQCYANSKLNIENITLCMPWFSYVDEQMSKMKMNICDHQEHCLGNDFYEHCESVCPRQCVRDIYHTSVVHDGKLDQFDYDTTKYLRSEVYITHNDLPDQVIAHTPAMSMIQLVSSFGGLLGMWLGLSFIMVLKYLYKQLWNYLQDYRKAKRLTFV